MAGLRRSGQETRAIVANLTVRTRRTGGRRRATIRRHLGTLAATDGSERLIWTLGLGAMGLAWPTATIAAFLPTIMQEFTSSDALIGIVLAAEGVFALLVPLVVGPLSDGTATPLGRRRPYMLLAVPPMAISVALAASAPTLLATAALLFVFYFATYVYEPPWRGLYADLLRPEVAGRAQSAAHVLRGVAMAGALVGGGLALTLWEPLPFLIAASVAAAACSIVALRVREPRTLPRRAGRLRSRLAAPLRLVRRDRTLRRFMIVNTAWETTFAGMRTFVVLYVVEGLDQPLYVSSAVLAVVAVAYVAAAALLGPFVDGIGVGRVVLWAAAIYGIGLFAAGFATQWNPWFFGVIALVALAGGTVMTLAWGLLLGLMPGRDEGAISGLAVTTRGIGLLLGPPAVGIAVDLCRPVLQATDGYAAVWFAVAVPVLVTLPLVARLAKAERNSPDP
jgi:MFS family permease